jgi:hypothetical protein
MEFAVEGIRPSGFAARVLVLSECVLKYAFELTPGFWLCRIYCVYLEVKIA